jgi:hypothetical protein
VNILIISGAFFPEYNPRSFRSTELVKEFCRQGHKVTYIGKTNQELLQPLINEFGFQYLPTSTFRFKNFSPNNSKLQILFGKVVNKVANYFFEYPDIEWLFRLPTVLKKLDNYDLLISIAVPHPIHWSIGFFRNRSRKIANVWVADCGDCYYLNELVTYKPPFYFKYIESNWCKKADFISNPMEEMANNFLDQYKHKCVEIPQGFKIEDSEQFLRKYIEHSKPTFLFSGAFIPQTRDPRPLLEYLVSKDWDFEFHIYTTLKQYVQPYMKKANSRIILHDYIPREELLAVQSEMDFLVNFTFNPKQQVPSKLIDYLITKRPILNIDPILDHKLVDEFMAGDYTRRFNKLTLDRYRIENVVAKFLSLLKVQYPSNSVTSIDNAVK